MKTLKLFRALSMAGGLTCFMISCLPDIKGENGYDWMMIAAITLVLVILPTTLIVRIKRENHPETLTEFNKGYHTINVICAIILPEVVDRQESLACCSPLGHTELDTTERPN